MVIYIELNSQNLYIKYMHVFDLLNNIYPIRKLRIFVNMLKLRFLLRTLLFLLLTNNTYAQLIKVNGNDSLKKKRSFYEDFYWGSNFNLGLGFGFGGVTTVDISPFAAYKVTKDVSVGLCGVYNYFGFSTGNGFQSINIYGGRAFSRVKIFQQFFAQAEAESLYLSARTLRGKLQANGYFAGLGFDQSPGNKFSSFFVLLYNFEATEINPFPLVYRVGFHIGF
jgi:hypothetical protein